MNITKQPPPIVGPFGIGGEITLNFAEKTFYRGYTIGDQHFSGAVSMAVIFQALTQAQRDAVLKFIQIGTRMAANNGISPQTPLIDTDIQLEAVG